MYYLEMNINYSEKFTVQMSLLDDIRTVSQS